MATYTNVAVHRGKILDRGYDSNGRRFNREVPYKPFLFVQSRQPDAEFRSHRGGPLDQIRFDSIADARQYLNEYKGVTGFPVYGMTNWVYPYIFETYRAPVEFDMSLIRAYVIDIEVAADEGFPNVQTADKPITSIAVYDGSEYVVFATDDYTGSLTDFRFVRCRSEHHLIESFLAHYRQADPDIITGWNVETFDVPYLINRTTGLLGEVAARRLSPWGILQERTVEIWGRPQQIYVPVGVSILDYLQLYKKFVLQMQESYRLDAIAEKELGERKVSYTDEYKSLDDLRVRNFNLFIEYNVQDVRLVVRLDERLQFIRQALTIAYDARVNYNDVFGSVRMWDVMIHNYLLEQRVAVPPMPVSMPERDQIEGAYVKEPQTGRHRSVVSFDLASLYPSLIMQYNISPDTFRGSLDHRVSVDAILDGAYAHHSEVRSWHDQGCTVTAAGVAFTKLRQGFLPALMERMFADRQRYKKQMLAKKKQLEATKDADQRAKLQAEIQRLDAMQQARKVGLNSAYGALGNPAYRWYRREFAESITLSGQLSIRWMERWLNQSLNRMCETNDVDFVVAIDTDSLYLNLDRLVSQKFDEATIASKPVEVSRWIDQFCESVIAPRIEKGYQKLAEYMSAARQQMSMKREAIALAGFWVGKKRYALLVYNHEGVEYAEPQLKMTGLDAVRSSTPIWIKGVLQDAFRILMSGTEQQLQDHVRRARREFPSQPFSQTSKTSSANGMSKYRLAPPQIFRQGCPIHVRGALLYNWWIEHKGLTHIPPIYEGDKVKFAYLKLPNPLRHNVIAVPAGEMPSELGLHSYIDHDTQFDKMVVGPIQHAADLVGWQTVKRASLSSFFV